MTGYGIGGGDENSARENRQSRRTGFAPTPTPKDGAGRQPCKKSIAPVTAVTPAESTGRSYYFPYAGASPAEIGEMVMLDLLTFTAVAIALGVPWVLPLMWGQTESA